MTTRAGMTIGEVAERSGVSRKALRYYEELGLLPRAARDRAGYRRYDAADLRRLEFIGRAKGLGLSLEEIGGVLAASADGGRPCQHVLGLLDEHVRRIDDTVARLSELRAHLAEIRARARRSAPGVVCGIIEHAALPPSGPPEIARPLARSPRA